MDETRLLEIEGRLDADEDFGGKWADLTTCNHLSLRPADVRALIAEVRRLRPKAKTEIRIEPGETRNVSGVPVRNLNDFAIVCVES